MTVSVSYTLSPPAHTMRIEAGWNTDVIGSMQLEVDEGGGTVVVAIPDATYCHTDISAVMGTGEYTDFASAVETALNGSGSLSGTYTVTYSASSLEYTVAIGTGTVALGYSAAATQRAMLALGFGAAQTAFGSRGSTQRPYYIISGAVGAASNVSDDYEPRGVVEGAEADDGTPYSVARSAAPVYYDFECRMESKAAVFKRSATPSVPWTYRHLWEHVRGAEPMLVDDDTDQHIVKLRADAASWKPARVTPDWDDLWDVPFGCHLLGRL